MALLSVSIEVALVHNEPKFKICPQNIFPKNLADYRVEWGGLVKYLISTFSVADSFSNFVFIGTLKKVYVHGTTPSILHLYALTGWGPNFRGLCSRTLSRPL